MAPAEISHKQGMTRALPLSSLATNAAATGTASGMTLNCRFLCVSLLTQVAWVLSLLYHLVARGIRGFLVESGLTL